MSTHEAGTPSAAEYPVTVSVRPATENRNRLTTFFRFFLAIPHFILVGGPAALATSIMWSSDNGWGIGWGSGGGLLGVVVCVTTVISWFAILFTGNQPEGLRKFNAYYLGWRMRVIGYLTLLRDEYPPFGEGDYHIAVALPPMTAARNRLTVAFRAILAIPHFFVLGLLSVLWAFTTAVAWVWILITGRYPEMLYGFAIGMLAWSARLDAYMLLLRDEYPPFTLRA